MAEKYDGWAIRNKWGSFLIWTMAPRKKDVIDNLGQEKYQLWKKLGHKIVKVKLTIVEVK